MIHSIIALGMFLLGCYGIILIFGLIVTFWKELLILASLGMVLVITLGVLVYKNGV